MGELFKVYFIIALVLLFVSDLYAQSNKLQQKLGTGDYVTGLTFGSVINYKDSILKLDDLKGKYIILDFWTTGCASCFESMPHLEKLQQDYNAEIQIILINPWESKEKINKRLRQRLRLIPDFKMPNLPLILGDTIWREIFPHQIVPHHVWIDPDGKVVAATNGWNTNEENIRKLLQGKHVSFAVKDDFKLDRKIIVEQNLIQPIDSGLLVKQYSSILGYNSSLGTRTGIQQNSVKNIVRYYKFNASIVDLYRAAFKIAAHEKSRVLIEADHPSEVEFSGKMDKYDDYSNSNRYCYELVLPLNWKDRLNEFMVTDLNRYFKLERGITGTMEKRSYPAYVLCRLPGHEIKVLTSKDTIIDTGLSYAYINQPVTNVESYMKRILEDLSQPIAFQMELGLTKSDKISIDLPKEDGWGNIKNVNETFGKQGYELKLEQREIDVLVIKQENR